MFRRDAAHRAEPKGPDSHVAPARPDVSGGPASRARLCVSQFRASVVALCVLRRRTFALQDSINNRFYEYPGTYSVDGTNITLDFGQARKATGTLTDDSFTVKYNDIMQHSDFVDSVYMRDR